MIVWDWFVKLFIFECIQVTFCFSVNFHNGFDTEYFVKILFLLWCNCLFLEAMFALEVVCYLVKHKALWGFEKKLFHGSMNECHMYYWMMYIVMSSKRCLSGHMTRAPASSNIFLFKVLYWHIIFFESLLWSGPQGFRRPCVYVVVS